MNAPFAAQTVIQRFLRNAMDADSALQTAIGGPGRIYPNVSPSGVTVRHLTHQFYGGVQVPRGNGSSIGMVTVRWAFTAWEPSYSQQALEPVMQALMEMLIGVNLRGKTHRYVDTTSSPTRVWDIYVDYFAPDIVELEVAPAGTWAPLREVYQMSLQQAA